MSNPLTQVVVLPVNPPGQPLTFALFDDSTYDQAGGGANGGWQIVDRPRNAAAMQWYDRSPWQLVGKAALDSNTLFGNNITDIEPYCLVLESWVDKVPGTLLPPILSITGPVPGVQRKWVLYKASFGKAIRDSLAGYRVYQEVDLTFYEYNAPLTTISGLPSPAQTAQANLAAETAAQSYNLYTVSGGDTLVSIAATQMGDWTQWTTLATLNNVRDPNSLSVGQTIKIPII